MPASQAPSVCSCPGPGAESGANTSCSSDTGALGGGGLALLAARKTFSNPCTPRPSAGGPELLGAIASTTTCALAAHAENVLSSHTGNERDDEDTREAAEEEDRDLGAEDVEKFAGADDQQHADLHKSSSVFGQTQNLPLASHDEAVKTCISR